jgi:hypothetical protein
MDLWEQGIECTASEQRVQTKLRFISHDNSVETRPHGPRIEEGGCPEAFAGRGLHWLPRTALCNRRGKLKRIHRISDVLRVSFGNTALLFGGTLVAHVAVAF